LHLGVLAVSAVVPKIMFLSAWIRLVFHLEFRYIHLFFILTSQYDNDQQPYIYERSMSFVTLWHQITELGQVFF